MASFDTASKKQVETNPQDFVNLCFKFGLTNITALEVITPEQPTVEMHQADILIKALLDNQEVLVHFEFQTTDNVSLIKVECRVSLPVLTQKVS